MLYPIATLETDTLSAIQDLEQELGSPVVALAEVDVTSAELGAEKLKKLRALEDELGLVLVAVRKN